MSIDFMNMSYENRMVMKYKFYDFSPMYMYILRKKYKDFKGSQIAINESPQKSRHPELASIRTQALPVGIKLVYGI